MEFNKSGEVRVAEAKKRKESYLRQLCTSKGLEYPPQLVFLRAFKKEQCLELWASPQKSRPYLLLKSFDIAGMSGVLGPKRREGDKQVPEGLYHVDRFNPNSRFHLSLGLNYPNASDKVLSDKKKPGGDIFIHGNRMSIGCLAMTDDKIEEIYLLALGARQKGQIKIPVHIFPARLKPKTWAALREEYQENPTLIRFWENLKLFHDAFEKRNKVPQFKVQADGSYILEDKLNS